MHLTEFEWSAIAVVASLGIGAIIFFLKGIYSKNEKQSEDIQDIQKKYATRDELNDATSALRKVTVISDSRDVPDDALIGRVVEKLEENKIIGVELTVAKAAPLFIDISGSLLLDSGYSLADVTESIRKAINSYFFDIAFDKKTSYLSYHKVSELIFSAPGVVDIIAFTVNSQMAALPIGREEFCKLRAVEFDAG